jgi:FkbM family methyltransferase
MTSSRVDVRLAAAEETSAMRNIPRKIGFVLAASEHGSLIVNRFDYNRLGDREYGIANQLFETGGWERREMAILLYLLRCRRQFHGDGVWMIDCGANIGVLTVEAAAEMTGWGSVLAIEAQERLFYALAGNIALNNCFNARAVHAAVAAEDGSLRVPVPDYLKVGSFGSLELRPRPENEFIGQNIDYSAEAMQEIRAVKLDNLAADRVDLIKIDIEGREIEALQGGAGLIARHRPVLLVEWIKTPKQQLRTLLEGFGYQLFEGAMNIVAVHRSDPGLPQIVQSLTAAPAPG